MRPRWSVYALRKKVERFGGSKQDRAGAIEVAVKHYEIADRERIRVRRNQPAMLWRSGEPRWHPPRLRWTGLNAAHAVDLLIGEGR